jgi:hypothetical protein
VLLNNITVSSFCLRSYFVTVLLISHRKIYGSLWSNIGIFYKLSCYLDLVQIDPCNKLEHLFHLVPEFSSSNDLGTERDVIFSQFI